VMFWKPKKSAQYGKAFPFPFSWAFVVFAGLSGMLLWMEGSKYYDVFRSRNWERVSCRITMNEVESRERSSGVEYRPSISYSYSFGGRNYSNGRIKLTDSPWQKDYSEVAEVCAKYPVGSVKTCSVNPVAPEEATLERSVNSFPPIVIFPLIIWAVYERVALALWWRGRKTRQKRGSGSKLLSDDILGTKAGRAEGWMAFGTGAGSLTLLAAIWIVPMRRSMEARSWNSAPCVILRSEVRTETQHQGQSFSAEVLFGYEVEGKHLESSRLDLGSDMSMSYSAVKERLAAYPAGSTNVCFYNPVNPREAVLQRGSTPDFFLSAFGTALLGMSGFLGLQSRVTRARGASPTGLPRVRKVKGEREQAFFSARKEALLVMAGCAVGMLIGAYIGARLLTYVIRSIRDLTVELLPLLYFLLCTGGVGWCARTAFRSLDKLRFPTPKLELAPRVLMIGGPFVLRWTFDRRPRGVRSLKLVLLGREMVVYTKIEPTLHGPGEQAKTKKAVTQTINLVEKTDPQELAGEVRAEIPEDAMHTLRAARALYTWILKLEEQLESGKKIEHEFEVIVLPASIPQQRTKL
jgi:hypothetical protein